MENRNTTSHQTGDINLAAALMACGVPPSREQPIKLIQPESGKKYASFRLGPCTMDGKEKTENLMDVWAGRRELEPSHGFEQICRFLKARPRGCRDTEALLDFAIDYLRKMGFALSGVRHMGDIEAKVQSEPQSVDSFILAFIHCRELLFSMFRQARTDFYFERGHGADTRRGMIAENLPAWQRRELTSRLNG
jgi:hypothetical protein